MLQRTKGQTDLLKKLDNDARDDYLFNYLLNVEAQGSILSIKDFYKPFDYKLKIAKDSVGSSKSRNVDLIETFNYLIGLTVKQYDSNMAKGYVRIVGSMPDGKEALVVWRDCESIGSGVLPQLSRTLGIDIEHGADKYDVIYINGDHNLLRPPKSARKQGRKSSPPIHQIEAIFINAMFVFSQGKK